MQRLPLTIVRGMHAPSKVLGHPVEAVRAIAEISLKSTDDWTPFQAVVVDTGAPISSLPRTLWRASRYKSHGRAFFGGITSRPECQIAALLAELDCVLSNGPTTIGPLRMYAYLAEDDRAPALLGMSGFIGLGTLHVQLSTNDAYIELE